MQPWWVQIAENALNVPALGWVITNCGVGEDDAAADRDVAVAASLAPAAPAPPEGLPSGCAGGAGAGAAWPGP